MPEVPLAGSTALVTGASRGFGRGIAAALSNAGARVVGVARDRGPLEEARAELGESFTAVTADAADPVVAGTPDLAGKAVTGLLADPGYDQDAYVLTAAGLVPVPGMGT